MNVLWGAVILAVAAAAAIGGMLLCRRRAPDGGYFADGDRAAGVFGVLATGFSDTDVLLPCDGSGRP